MVASKAVEGQVHLANIADTANIVELITCSCEEKCRHRAVYGIDANGDVYRSLDATTFHLEKALNLNTKVEKLCSTKAGVVAVTKDGEVRRLERDERINLSPPVNATRILSEKNKQENKDLKIVQLDISENAAAFLLNDGSIVFTAQTGITKPFPGIVEQKDRGVQVLAPNALIIDGKRLQEVSSNPVLRLSLSKNDTYRILFVVFEDSTRISATSMETKIVECMEADLIPHNVEMTLAYHIILSRYCEKHAVKEVKEVMCEKEIVSRLETEPMFNGFNTGRAWQRGLSTVWQEGAALKIIPNSRDYLRLFKSEVLRFKGPRKRPPKVEYIDFPLPHAVKDVKMTSDSDFDLRANVLMENGKILVAKYTEDKTGF